MPTAEDVKRHPHLVPDFADAQGRVALRVQAFVIEIAGRLILVDPCVGNGKKRTLPFWNERSWPFLERFADHGVSVSRKVSYLVTGEWDGDNTSN